MEVREHLRGSRVIPCERRISGGGGREWSNDQHLRVRRESEYAGVETRG